MIGPILASRLGPRIRGDKDPRLDFPYLDKFSEHLANKQRLKDMCSDGGTKEQ